MLHFLAYLNCFNRRNFLLKSWNLLYLLKNGDCAFKILLKSHLGRMLDGEISYSKPNSMQL